MRIGLMGYGVVASYGHVPAILHTPGLELTGVFDPSGARIEALKKDTGLEIGTTVESEFWDKQYDAIVVASPVAFHVPNARAAIARGYPVLCEKPLTLTESDSRELIDFAKANGVPVAVGFVYRFSPISQTIKTWVDEGKIGEVRAIRVVYLWDLHGEWEESSAGEWVKSPRWRDRMLEGGPMVDCGVHGIDLARFWSGSEILAGLGHGAWVSNYDAPDTMHLHLDHECGLSSTIEMSFTFGHTCKNVPPIFQYHLVGTGGVIRYQRDGWHLECHSGNESILGPSSGEKNFDGMYVAFHEALSKGDFSTLPLAEDGLIATKWARDATDRVIETRQQRLNLSK